MEYSELIKDFLDDADAHLKEYDTALLSLEKNGQNKEVILNTLGALHTLKGGDARSKLKNCMTCEAFKVLQGIAA